MKIATKKGVDELMKVLQDKVVVTCKACGSTKITFHFGSNGMFISCKQCDDF